MAKELAQVDHNVFRYANCWEDAEVLLAALHLNENAKVLSIGSAGDNSFSLLTKNPKQVLCLDLNATQLALIELKKAAFKTLNYTEFLIFLGFKNGDNYALFGKVKRALTPELIAFWKKNKKWIEDGIIYQGKFEKYLLVFQKRILPFLHKPKTVEALFSRKTEEEQKYFYQKKWNTWRWKLIASLFFSRKVLGWGRDPAFLEQVKGNVGKQIKVRINAHLSSAFAQQNYFLRFMLLGNFGATLPHYARAENFEVIKAQVHKITCMEGTLSAVKNQNFTHANLSNIFEYMSDKVFENNSNQLAQIMERNARITYWNLMVARKLETVHSDFVSLNEQLLPNDKGFFYQAFNTSKKV